MSYNIDSWKTKKIENLSVPMPIMTEYAKEGAFVMNLINGSISVTGGSESFEMVGTLSTWPPEKADFIIKSIHNSGESSGRFQANVVDDILSKSRGTLEAVLVWEGGDSVEKCTWVDGVQTTTELDF